MVVLEPVVEVLDNLIASKLYIYGLARFQTGSHQTRSNHRLWNGYLKLVSFAPFLKESTDRVQWTLVTIQILK